MVPEARANKIGALVSLLFLGCSAPSPTPLVRPSAAVAPEPAVLPPPSSAPSVAITPPPKKSDRFAVSTENGDAANVAASVFRSGGNAFDAAVAGVLMASVTQPASTGLGGDGFAVVWSGSEKKAAVIDFRARAPVSLQSKDHIAKSPAAKKRGVMVGVPGLVAGLFALHDKRGKLPWADVVRLAAESAEKGFSPNAYTVETFSWLGEDPANAALLASFGVSGDSKDLGERSLTNKALAATLRAIADGGPRAFYEGDVARDIIDTTTNAGGSMARSDLTSYEAVTRDAFDVHWNGFDVLTAPQPSGGGFVVAEMLGLFDAKDVEKLGFDSADYVHALADGLRQAGEDRALAIGDPEFTKMDPSSLLTADRLKEKRASFRGDSTTLPKRPSARDKGTFHFVVIDADENVVSITTTVTSLFGSKLMTKSGFVLNDALTDFTMDEYGLKPTNKGPNFPRGGARPASSMAPVVVVKDGVVVCALGASGGYRIPAGVTEVLFGHLVFGRPIADAVSAPRFQTTPTGALLLDGGLASLAGDLAARGEILEDQPSDFSAVSAVAVKRDSATRTFEAAGDPRKHGIGLVVSASD